MKTASVPSGDHTPQASRFVHVHLPVEGTGRKILDERITTDRIVGLALDNADPMYAYLTYLSGSWQQAEPFPFQERLPVHDGTRLHSVTCLSTYLRAFDGTSADPSQTGQAFIQLVRALNFLTHTDGNPLQEVFFVGGASVAAPQYLADTRGGQPYLLWEPGRVGVTNVRALPSLDLLIGVMTDERGNGKTLVWHSLSGAIQKPELLTQASRWNEIALVTDDVSAVWLSRAAVSNGAIALWMTRQPNGSKCFQYRLAFIVSSEAQATQRTLIADTWRQSPGIVIGEPHKTPHALVSYEPSGVGSDAVSIRVDPREGSAFDLLF